MKWIALFSVLLVLALVWMARKTGRARLTDRDLARGMPVRTATREEPGEGWEDLGSRTTTRGLDLRFDHDDDPEAEASFPARPARPPGGGQVANSRTVTLSDRFETHHVHTAGYVFRISLRGTGSVVGARTRIKMFVTTGGVPVCGRVENDDSETPAAVGDWIEVERVEILRVTPTGSPS